jgi:peptidoglycan/xylan/chitin deacetylase (PgdA/CDA1 family)
MYHSITTGESVDPYGVSINDFYDQISWLFDHDFQFVSLETIFRLLKNGLFFSGRKLVALTFDDGYQDFLINVLPILLSKDLPATVFLVTELLGKTASWSRYSQHVPLMNQAAVREVKAQGVSLGSHSLTHADLTSIADQELRRQLVGSQIALAQFGETFFSFSYPWAKYTNREVAALKAAGYQCAVAADEKSYFFKTDMFRLGRLTMRHNLKLDAFERIVDVTAWSQYIPAKAQYIIRFLRKKMLPN